jgi:hypothetical protein
MVDQVLRYRPRKKEAKTRAAKKKKASAKKRKRNGVR